MNKKIIFLSLLLSSISGYSQNIDKIESAVVGISDTIKKQTLNEVVVSATRVNKNSPVAHENITSDDIEKQNHGVDLPILLDQATSVVTTSDAGGGVGYTGIRIRGSDATRVNVTINGIPLNDAESQGSFWVDLPDISSSTASIQIQRGVGSSTNGAGAFGASINLNTLGSDGVKPFGEISNSFGSFNTIKNTVRFGTGLLNNNWTFEGRLSQLKSDGYIDRASSDLKSYYLSGGYVGDKTMLKAVVFSGHEKTYQAWNGVPVRYLDSSDASLRTYNSYTYENEVDNYDQTHYQLHFVQKIEKYSKFNISLHYTRGLGYYEQYRTGDALSDYGLENINTLSGDTIENTDLIRRRWLDNHFYGTVFSYTYAKKHLNLIFGGGANQYIGGHYGEVVWAQYASNGKIRHRYYDDDATKNDVNFYAKLDYKIGEKLNVLVDLQQRMIQYDFLGFDDELNSSSQSISASFFNPKAGVNYVLNDNHSLYGFFGVGNKEPNRDDYTNSTPTSRPSHEHMTDLEIGYKLKSKKAYANVNFYSMDYTNQLILTGAINDVGAAVRTNVASSYRRGIEISGGISLLKNLEWKLNTTFSDNKIASFTEFIDDWDTWGQVETNYEDTDIAFSPSLIASNQLIFKPVNSEKYGNIELALVTKYVGDQYIDNTSNSDRMLAAYLVNDIRLQYSVKTKLFKEMVWSAWVRNFTNTQYVSNAWIYKFKSANYNPVPDDTFANKESVDGRYNLIGAFPQAGINFFTGLILRF
jgi:iron complex outermembrane receptor protein